MPSHRSLPLVEPTPPRGLRAVLLRAMSSPAAVAMERSLPFRLVVWRLAPRLLRASGGRLAALLPFPAAVIETRDARNGRPHRRVVAYFHDGDRVILAASRGGMASDPHWYRNAVAEPRVRLGGSAYRAAPVSDAGERERLWQLADRVYPPHAVARAQAGRSGRTVPLLQLIPDSVSE